MKGLTATIFIALLIGTLWACAIAASDADDIDELKEREDSDTD